MNWPMKAGRAAVERARRALNGSGPPPVTLGVRVAAFDGPKILLVRHTYMAGWHMPGGAVDRGESAADAAVRELQEETWVEAEGTPRLIGFYFNPMKTKSDHIALYVCDRWRAPNGLLKPNMEIAEVGFFDAGALPDGTTYATKLRIAEIAGQSPLSHLWKA
jgi:8-oxo-dGTP pyrophosphatase MutT (NUDIX family)